MDDLTIWDVALGSSYLEADGASSMGGISPGSIQLSCVHCTILQAEEGCLETHHLCSEAELKGGVYYVAETLGWTSLGLRIWNYRQQEPSTNLGVGICCID